MACSSSKPKPSDDSAFSSGVSYTVSGDVASLGIQLTKIGDNVSPSLSADGKRIAFISRQRPNHSQGQVYVFDLDQLRERRVTYQDGECGTPFFLKDGRLVYSSTTDEIKERPRLFQKAADTSFFPPSELYLSDLSGQELVRLTQHPGFDGMGWPRPDRNDSILFARWNGKSLEYLQMNLSSRQTIPLPIKSKGELETARLSPDGKQWAWIEKASEGTQQIWVAPTQAPAKGQLLNLPQGNYKDLSWATNQSLIFASRSLKNNFQIYLYEMTKTCLQNLVDSKTNLGWPQFHSERQGLVFASTEKEISNLFYKSLPTSNECLKWETTTPN